MRVLVATVAMCLAACTVTTGPEQTTQFDTIDLTPSFVVKSDGTTLTIRARLYPSSGGGTGVELGAGDRLDVKVDGAPVALAKDRDAYQAKMPAPGRGAIAVAFRRSGTKRDALGSSVVLPESFTVKSTSDAWSARGDFVVRTVGVKATEVLVAIEGPCVMGGVDATSIGVGPSGEVVIAASRIHFVDAPECDLSVYLRLAASGTRDPELGRPTSHEEGTGVSAMQERFVSTHVSR